MREFVFGNNETGLVTNTSGTVSVIGGENSTLAEDILPGKPPIFYGSGTTMSTYTFPSATIAAWNAFIQTETATATATAGPQSSSNRLDRSMVYPLIIVIVTFLAFCY